MEFQTHEVLSALRGKIAKASLKIADLITFPVGDRGSSIKINQRDVSNHADE